VTNTIEPTQVDPSGSGASGSSADAAPAPKRRSGGLNSMLLADLKSMAGGLGIRGAGSMKKAQLVDAIKAAQAGANGSSEQRAERRQDDDRPRKQEAEREQAQDRRPEERREEQAAEASQSRPDNRDTRESRNRDAHENQSREVQTRDRSGGSQNKDRQQGQQQDRQQSSQQSSQQGSQQDDGQGGSRRSRRRRGRERGTRQQSGGQRNEPDTTILDDDVLTPAAGILDVLDNYAFVRTSGYLPGTDDVYVSLSMVRKYGLRRGDAVVGQVRQPREGERKEKFNPMVRIDSVNGADPEASKSRVDFAKLTPLYPNERLRLETEPTNLIGRVIDIAAPIGKGQRGLIVSPSKAGKTMIMPSIAKSITTNNPECHLMVVLVDERPEEVTDFERSTKGEVISSTFDRPAADHTMVAELAIERAKRLVELGHDVVVLLDGITRLGRAYNLAAPASGRILSGGVDSAALYPPKKFFGAARNIENGGSLTILATALIESGSKMDEVIFEEFKGTGNMEIRLRRDFADKRLFPAIDAVQSGTRREELLMSKEELQIVWKLRRVLSGLEGQQALELLIERLKKTQSNIEFLMQVQKTTPGDIADD
jgi:transcription termination factor Rho